MNSKPCPGKLARLYKNATMIPIKKSPVYGFDARDAMLGRHELVVIVSSFMTDEPFVINNLWFFIVTSAGDVGWVSSRSIVLV